MALPTHLDLGAAERNTLERAFKRIAEALRECRADFLLGAGMSAASGVPTGSVLARKLLDTFFPGATGDAVRSDRLEQLAAKFPFEAAVQAIEHSKGGKRDDLTKFLRTALLDERFVPSSAHHLLAQVSMWEEEPTFRRLFTTNFDMLLEAVFGGRAVPITESNTREITPALANGKLPILHLHGSLDGEYEISENDIFRDKFRALQGLLRASLAESEAFVLVGYSMNDPDLRAIFVRYQDDLVTRHKVKYQTYVVSPIGDDDEYSLSKALWETRGATLIPMDAETFFGHLVDELKMHGEQDSRAFIKTKFNLADDAAVQHKIQGACDLFNFSEADAIRFLRRSPTRTGRPI